MKKYAIIKQSNSYYVVSGFRKGGIFSNFEFFTLMYTGDGTFEHSSLEEAQETINKLLEQDRILKEQQRIEDGMFKLVRTGEVIATYES